MVLDGKDDHARVTAMCRYAGMKLVALKDVSRCFKNSKRVVAFCALADGDVNQSLGIPVLRRKCIRVKKKSYDF